jgi:hypothetical protein
MVLHRKTKRPEIDHRTIKLMVGTIAIVLAFVEWGLAGQSLDSISASYHANRWSRDVFVGSEFAIAAYLAAYNGEEFLEMVLSRVAAVAALGVALFPCKCGSHPEAVGNLHFYAAGAMFGVLAVFCGIFCVHAWKKREKYRRARGRAVFYAACGVAIIVSMAIPLVDHWTGDKLGEQFPRLVFWCEFAGLFAFGSSWLTASHVLPGVFRADERFHPFQELTKQPD